MKIWSISNQKGGVGKTTTVVTLGGILAGRGNRVLLVDLDPHGSLTSYFRMNPDEVETSVYTLFQDALAKRPLMADSCVVSTRYERISVLPAATALATIERHGGASGMGLVIANALASVRGQYDHVLLDSPPMLGVLMVNALAACQHLLVPVLPEFLALKGLERMMNTLDMVGRSRRVKLATTILPTMFDRRTRASVQTLQTMRELYGERLWRAAIPVDTKLREASQVGVPASIYAPGSKAVVAYSALLDDLLGLRNPLETREAVPSDTLAGADTAPAAV